ACLVFVNPLICIGTISSSTFEWCCRSFRIIDCPLGFARGYTLILGYPGGYGTLLGTNTTVASTPSLSPTPTSADSLYLRDHNPTLAYTGTCWACISLFGRHRRRCLLVRWTSHTSVKTSAIGQTVGHAAQTFTSCRRSPLHRVTRSPGRGIISPVVVHLVVIFRGWFVAVHKTSTRRKTVAFHNTCKERPRVGKSRGKGSKCRE
ncbi:unnamed protein product, partial [Ectocarpus sp. 13 AM-2016]